MGVGLRHGAPQPHLELVAAQRRVSVVADEAVEAVEHQVVSQVEAGGAGLLAGMDPAVLDAAGAPGERGGGAACGGVKSSNLPQKSGWLNRSMEKITKTINILINN